MSYSTITKCADSYYRLSLLHRTQCTLATSLSAQAHTSLVAHLRHATFDMCPLSPPAARTHIMRALMEARLRERISARHTLTHSRHTPFMELAPLASGRSSWGPHLHHARAQAHTHTSPDTKSLCIEWSEGMQPPSHAPSVPRGQSPRHGGCNALAMRSPLASPLASLASPRTTYSSRRSPPSHMAQPRFSPRPAASHRCL